MRVDVKNLWIGDVVRMKTSGRTGRFAGIHADGKARIDVNGTIILTAATNLEILPETEIYPDIDAFLASEVAKEKEKPGIQGNKKKKVPDMLDLHIDKLAPHLQGQPSGRILEFQLEQSALFIRQAIDAGMPHITIIHGKGQGVLKAAIEHQIKQFSQIKITFSKNGGGAVEIWL